VDFMTIRT